MARRRPQRQGRETPREGTRPPTTTIATAQPAPRQLVEAPSVDVVGDLTQNESVAASPTVRRLAQELGIDLTRVRGSQRGGRVAVEDLRGYIQQIQRLAFEGGTAPRTAAAPKAAAEKIDFEKWGPVSRKPVSSLRKIIAQRMHESWTSVPRVTQFDEADITGIVALRKKYVAKYEKKGVSLTLTPFLIRAVVAALKKYPIFNSSLDEATEEIVFKEYYHMGIAVDTEQGLIVPVIRDVDKKSLLQLSKELAELAEKTRAAEGRHGRFEGGHVYHFEPGWYRRWVFYADCEQARGGDPRRGTRRAQARCPGREDRETHAPAAGVVLRSPGYRRRCGGAVHRGDCAGAGTIQRIRSEDIASIVEEELDGFDQD